MSDIFISYAKSDKKIAKILAEVFEKQGWSVWWDPKIPPGKSWPEVIEEALSTTKCVVALWSKASKESKWVKKEARYADQRSILIPVLIENVEVPFEFDHLQAAQLLDWKEEISPPEVNKLIGSITTILGHPRVEKKKSTAIEKTEKRTPEQERLESRIREGGTQIPLKKSKLIWLLPSILVPFIGGMAVLGIYINKSEKTVSSIEIIKPESIGTVKEPVPSVKYTEQPVIPKTKFRSESRKLSKDTVKSMLQLLDFYCKEYDRSKEYSNPNGGGFYNNFEEKVKNGDRVILSHASGLMWQQSGSDSHMAYEKTKVYITKLNRERFAGYSDWRLPTLEEAMSLMEPLENRGGLYIDSRFDSQQGYIWTSDLYSASSAWLVGFDTGVCYYSDFINYHYVCDYNDYVRAVR